MTHLILCREYPPAPYPAGGIGTYVERIARLLAEAGETVHLIAQRWDGAQEELQQLCDGRLIIHRVSLDEPVNSSAGIGDSQLLSGLVSSDCPSQVFSWQAGQVAESLIESERIDVIEGQEWEAPLYYLQVRRALGLGPRKQPPCIVHLHSPSRLIFRYNEWDETLTDFGPLCRFEEYSIKAADALLCPSRYLACGAAELFGFDPAAVEVIPYPMGSTRLIQRAASVWASDLICYVGRLELRKGVVEWVDAAIKAADSHVTVRFEFIGSDTSLGGGAGGSVEQYLKDRIPRRLRSRFHFRGAVSRSQLFQALAEVSVAVVPSRWENLPFTCIEAMSTGLPVLTSPNGGMLELVTDAQSGWVAPDGTALGLGSALGRVLETSPETRAAMGRAAADAVRAVCADEKIVGRHLKLRARLARSGVTRSRLLPGPPGQPQGGSDRQGLGIVVTCMDRPELVAGCLGSIADQKLAPQMTIVVVQERFRDLYGKTFSALVAPDRLSVLYTPDASPDDARRLGIKTLLESVPNLRSLALIGEEVRLDPRYVSACESVFQRHSNAGLVSSWISHEPSGKELDTGPCPISAADFTGREFMEYAAVRAEPLLVLAALGMQGCTTHEALSKALPDGGWAAVTYPDLLVSVLPARGQSGDARKRAVKRYSVMALAQAASPDFAMQWFLAAPWREKVRWVVRAVRQPRRIARWIVWRFRRTAGGKA